MSAIDTAMALTDAINAQAWEAASASMTGDFTATGLAPFPLRREELIGGEQAWHAACPDRHATLEQAREVDGAVVAILKVTGTQTNTLTLPGFPPLPATGKRYEVLGNLTVTVRGNEVATMAFEATSPGVFQQLGVQAPPA